MPDGTNTVGSEITIVETGPNAPDPQTSTCTTDDSTVESGSTATYCVFGEEEVARQQIAAAAKVAVPAATGGLGDFYIVDPGDTATITQTTMNENLRIDTSTKTFGPCDDTGDGLCEGSGGSYNNGIVVTGDEALFTDEGLPPIAEDDTATTKINTPVAIDNLGNDSLGGAHTGTLTDLTEPEHGTATIVTDETPASHGAIRVAALAGTSQSLMYTPSHGFVGVDPFTYNLTTANGTSKATVTVTVVGPTTTTSAPPSTSAAPSTSPATSASSSAL